MTLYLKRVLWLSFLVVLVSTLLCHDITLASKPDERPPEPTEGFPASVLNKQVAPDNATILSTRYLKSWDCAITNLGGRKVRLSGSTDAYTSVDIIRVGLYLQVWDSSTQKWKDVRFVKGFESHNRYYTSGSATQTVSSKNYYRTRSVHYVKKGNIAETVSLVSGYIYIK